MNWTLLEEKNLFCLGLTCSGVKMKAGTTFFFSSFNCQISDVLSTKRKSLWNMNKFIALWVQEMDINNYFWKFAT
jgi:hypothetical protein